MCVMYATGRLRVISCGHLGLEHDSFCRVFCCVTFILPNHLFGVMRLPVWCPGTSKVVLECVSCLRPAG